MTRMNHDNISGPISDDPFGAPESGPIPDNGPTPDSEPIPDIKTAKLPFDSTEELRQRWRALMGPLGFSEPCLWIGFIDNDRLVPGALPRMTLPTVPDAHLIDTLVTQLRTVTDDDGHLSLAFLLTRPGSDGITARDLGWCRLLASAAQRFGVPILPIHRANDVALETIPIPIERAA